MDDMYMPCLHDLNSLQIVFLYEVGDCSIYVFFRCLHVVSLCEVVNHIILVLYICGVFVGRWRLYFYFWFLNVCISYFYAELKFVLFYDL